MPAALHGAEIVSLEISVTEHNWTKYSVRYRINMDLVYCLNIFSEK